ncbi:Putative Alpha 1,2-mannosyltransferase [Rhizopus microsporus]|nr:Putative Alpha 1,2-mannosyltransferase [Rhizopus microsporus]
MFQSNSSCFEALNFSYFVLETTYLCFNARQRQRQNVVMLVYLDRAGGFFYERWGDAPVHSIAASLMLRKDEIHFFDDIGYRHTAYTHCPSKPEYAAKCSCNPEKSLDYTDGISCRPVYDNALK